MSRKISTGLELQDPQLTRYFPVFFVLPKLEARGSETRLIVSIQLFAVVASQLVPDGCLLSTDPLDFAMASGIPAVPLDVLAIAIRTSSDFGEIQRVDDIQGLQVGYARFDCWTDTSAVGVEV